MTCVLSLIAVNRLSISSLDAAMLAVSETISFTISPSAIAPGCTPVESIRTPFPVSSKSSNVKFPCASRPACILTTPLSSFHCWVAPDIWMPPSSDMILNLLVLIVPASRSAMDTDSITAVLISAVSITALSEVRWMFCRSPIPADPERRFLILA